LWQVSHVAGYLTALALCVAGFCGAWHAKQSVEVWWLKVDGVHAGNLWHVEQAVGNLTGFETWFAGLLERWHEAHSEPPGCLKPQAAIVSMWQAEQLVP